MPGDDGASLAEGWYGDPWRSNALRWWDGRQWTDHTSTPIHGDHRPPTRDSLDQVDSEQVVTRVAPANLPAVLSSPSRMIGPICALALAAVPLISMCAFFFGNHNGFSWNLVAGESVLTVIFSLLLWNGLRMLKNPPSLGMNADGVIIHHGKKDVSLAWEDVADVGITMWRAEGLTFLYPTIRDVNGKEPKVAGLVETPKHVERARDAVAVIVATRDQQLGLN